MKRQRACLIWLAQHISVQVCAPFVSFPPLSHSEIGYIANTTLHYDYYRTFYTTKSLHTNATKGMTASRSSSGSVWSSGNGSVRHRHSFSHQFPVYSTTFLPIFHPTPISVVPFHFSSFPIYVTRHSKPNPSNTHPQTPPPPSSHKPST
jgi:hypothetical protein